MVQDLLHSDKRVEAARVPQNARQHPSSSSAPNQASSSSAPIQPNQQSSSSAPSRQVPMRRNRRKNRKNPPIDGAKIMKSLLKNLNRWNRSKNFVFFF